jgi:hypothetical protein
MDTEGQDDSALLLGYVLMQQLKEPAPDLFERLITRREMRTSFHAHPAFLLESVRLRTRRSGLLLVCLRCASDGQVVSAIFHRVRDDLYAFGGISF